MTGARGRVNYPRLKGTSLLAREVHCAETDGARARQIAHEVAKLARSLLGENAQVIWFGSWVSGLPAPGSDVDLCLILSASDKPPRDRASEYLPLGFPVGVDLFAYTKAEFRRLKQENPGWYQAITSGREI